MTKFQKKLWIGLIIMALLTPLGVYLPEKLGAGDAWGEWGTETIEKMLGYVPEGMKKIADIWKAPVSDYNLGGDSASMTVKIISYVVSAVVGIGLVAIAVYFIGKLMRRHEK